MTLQISERLTNALNRPEYWDGLKYYLRVDLADAWQENDVAYWKWAVQCAQTHPRAKRLIQDCLQDVSFGQPEHVFRCLDLCAQHGFEIGNNVLGRASEFSVEVVEQIVARLPKEHLDKSATPAVYCAIKSNNTQLLLYYDTLFNFVDIRTQFQDLCKSSPEHFDGCVQALEPYILKKKLTEATQMYDSGQRIKKM